MVHYNLLEKKIKKYRLGCIRQVAIWIFLVITSWKSDSSMISSVALDKSIFQIFKPLFLKLDKYEDGHRDGRTYRQTDKPESKGTSVSLRLQLG